MMMKMTGGNDLNKGHRIIYIASWILRGGAICCFLYGGALGAKDLGPEAFQKIKEAITTNSLDPLELHKKEMQQRKAWEEAQEKSRGAQGEMAKDGYASYDDEYGSNSHDNPYQYIAGGKKSGDSSQNSEDEISSEDINAPTHGEDADKIKSLWDKQSGDAGIDLASAKGASGAGGMGAAGSGGSGATAALGKLKKTIAGRGASMQPKKGGTSIGGKSGRSSRHGVRNIGTAQTGKTGGAQGLRSNAAYLKQEEEKFKSGDIQGMMKVAGAAGGDGMGRGKALNIPLGSAVGGVVAGAALGHVFNPVKKSDIHVPSGKGKRSENYDSKMAVINGLILASAILGIILIELIPARDKQNGILAGSGNAWWWPLFAAGVLMMLAAAALIVDLGKESDYAKGLSQGYWGAIVPLTLGYILTAANSMTGIAQMSMVGSGMQGLMKFLQKSKS